jgi:serine/threonine protein kinase
MISPDELIEKVKSGAKFQREDTSSIGVDIVQQGSCRTAIAFDIRRILLGFSIAAKILNRDYHNKGKIHCDLTPTNILVLADAFVPIDSMDIPPGAVAPGGTLEWSAPEQILYQPVSDKTDVFSLALIVVALLGGSMFGQISEYVVASKPQNLGIKKYSLDTVKLLPTPELTLARFEAEHENSVELPIDQLKKTLRKCLQLDPLVRPTILELAASLSDFAFSAPLGPECVDTFRSGYGEGNLYSWINENGVEEYFWKSSYKTNRIFTPVSVSL